tara:strand:- start:3174 stop:3866 length:693 start_codon:yes stop_codon:yes gene_type:complete
MPDPVSGAVVGSAVIGAGASRSAAKTQAGAADRAAELQRDQFERQVELQAPFREVGVRALPELEAASRYTMFGPEQFSKDPGYGFRLAEGQKALERNAAARGGLISGGALKAATRFGQDMGSQEYTNAFNRYQIERNARLGPLQSLAGFGQTSVNQLGQAGQNYATNAGNLMTGGAAAQAAGQVGAANAITGGLGTYLNYNQNQAQNSLLQQVLQNRGTPQVQQLGEGSY